MNLIKFMGVDQKVLFLGRYCQSRVLISEIDESSKELWFIRIMSTLKY
jgi:hypothetical protein